MILDKILEKKRKKIEERKIAVSLEEMKNKALKIADFNGENRLKSCFKSNDLSLIGEFKKASPSKGIIAKYFHIEEIEKFYKSLKVNAYSVLTEEDFFYGSDENLRKLNNLTTIPIIKKDFIIDFYQIYEAKIFGACGILLIVSVLGEKLKEFYDECIKFNLEPLIEVHDKEELDIALKCGGEIIGINNRNLKDFTINLDTTKNLIKYIPKEKVVVSESGINTIDDLKKVKGFGVDAVLIGEMFMRNINNLEFIRQLKAFRND
ncbi:indole-3-glycerol phosphate synthase TrpC [Clostridium aquiflavi]|uniref:Indole-3-glycerol phosphate synthase n=1 Tax=Clostridium aquiflavi TaxID=3073603 RepID=A0ABU1EK94_9CLOT|nr:indole-3-glycerol phosphate synthase TrpC [Clostridium sp. 5N-1]MDR5588719.1 indole-3-glycerol phosphate synthase TrpC [Clostridium sp. 5N-1]